jgi:CDP-diacylglycerol--serine O-phosphatidyltransferase
MGTVLVVGTLVGVIFLPKQFFFPALMGYVVYGLARTVFFGLMGRLPQGELAGEDDLLDDELAREGGGRVRRRRRRRRGQSEDPSPATLTGTPEEPGA